MAHKSYQEWQSPQELVEYIDCIWTLKFPTQIKTVIIIPDGCTDLIFDLNKQTSFWGGIMTKSSRFFLESKQYLIGVRFKAGAARAFLPCPLSELANQIIASNKLGFQDQFLIERLMSLNKIKDCVNFIYKWLAEDISFFPKNKIILSFFSKIKYHNTPKINTICDELGITRQYLAKNFREHIGIEPKALCQTLRIQSFVKSMPWENLKNVNWAQRAFDFGFYDQSHMINECKDILGLTPSEITREEFL